MPFILPPPGFQDRETLNMVMMKDVAREQRDYLEARRELFLARGSMPMEDEIRAFQAMGIQPGWENYQRFTPPIPLQMPQPVPFVQPSYMSNSPDYLTGPAQWPAQTYQQMPPPPIHFDPFGMGDFDPTAYHAPAMNPRFPASNPNFQPFNFTSRRASPTRSSRPVTTNEALSTWYAEQVVMVLLKPGLRRPGVGGCSDDIWGPGGRWKDEWERADMPAPDFSRHWGRMGMTETPELPARYLRPRIPSQEPYDPWNIGYKHEDRVNKRLVAFVYEMVQRMSISPTATVAASWYLFGLGLHEGDGEKGRKLREFLRGVDGSEKDAVEKRVAILGLLLAGKWLDDNSFLSKSWTEVTEVPIKDIDVLERSALADFHWCLSMPLSSWADHVNKSWADLMSDLENISDTNAVMLPLLDEMVTTARASEMFTPTTPQVQYYDYIDRRLEELYGEGVERSFTPVSQYYSPKEEEPVQNTVFDDTDSDSEDGFLEYDGATRFLPTMAEMRRSASNSTASSDALDSWRASLDSSQSSSRDETFAFVPPPTKPADHFYAKDRPDHARFNSSAMRGEPHPGYNSNHHYKRREILPQFTETGTIFEPGISQVRPPTSYRPNYSTGSPATSNYTSHMFPIDHYRPSVVGYR